MLGEKMGRIKLLEIGRQVKVVLKTYRYSRMYEVERVLRPANLPIKLDKKDLEEYVNRLRNRYPERMYQLKERKIKGKKYYVIWRKDGSKFNVPIYYSVEKGKFYVPKWYYRNRKKLTMFIVHRTLGALGVEWEKVQEN